MKVIEKFVINVYNILYLSLIICSKSHKKIIQLYRLKILKVQMIQFSYTFLPKLFLNIIYHNFVQILFTNYIFTINIQFDRYLILLNRI